MQIKADLHIHTTYSKDSVITPRELVYYAKKRGLNAVAVTDHNSIEGAYKIAKETDFLIIPGIEVSSSDGHIVALNVNEIIPRGYSAAETVKRIHQAGGVAIACHPYALFKGSLSKKMGSMFDAFLAQSQALQPLGIGSLGKTLNSTFDAIEVINARSFPYKSSIKKAKAAAERFKLSEVAGTDAHYGPQIGYAYTVIETPEPTIEAISEAIIEGHCQAFGQPVPVSMNMKLTFSRLKHKIRSQ